MTGLLALAPVMASAALLESIEVQRMEGRYRLAGEITIDAPKDAVFRVITDYDRLTQLNDSIAESRVVERPSKGVALVYTRLSGCVLFFCREIERVERVEEVSDSVIVAEVVPDANGNVRSAQSRWDLFESAGQTRVRYQTEIDPELMLPPLLGPPLLRRALRVQVAATLANLETAAQKR